MLFFFITKAVSPTSGADLQYLKDNLSEFVNSPIVSNGFLWQNYFLDS